MHTDIWHLGEHWHLHEVHAVSVKEDDVIRTRGKDVVDIELHSLRRELDFVKRPIIENDIWIWQSNLNRALWGDRVQIQSESSLRRHDEIEVASHV